MDERSMPQPLSGNDDCIPVGSVISTAGGSFVAAVASRDASPRDPIMSPLESRSQLILPHLV